MVAARIAEFFQDLPRDVFPPHHAVSDVETYIGRVLIFASPFLVYFCLTTFFAASVVQTFYVLNHGSILQRSRASPGPATRSRVHTFARFRLLSFSAEQLSPTSAC